MESKMITFKVDSVQKKTDINAEWLRDNNKRTVKGLVGNGVEASSLSEESFITSTHNLLSAINTAYDQHLPLVLSPDMLWLTISQGLSTHITNNAEQLRSQFVNFEGKKELIVEEDSFVKGNPNNDWPHMFGEFSSQLADYIGKKRDLIVNSFSTTGPVELAASEIVLMEAMSKYFDYTCRTCCGIPEITLLGTPQDWQDVLTRVRNISEFDLGWWTAKLEPIVQEFVSAAQGKPNTTFWKSIYKLDNPGSGGPYISGWITNLFPYLQDYSTSEFTLRNNFDTKGHRYTTDNFPIGMAKVPFKWEYYSEVFKMELAAGFTGFQFEEGAIRPQIGWFVRDTEAMIDIHATFEYTRGDYKKNDEVRNALEAQLAKFGFESQGYSYGPTITGCVPKEQLENVKQIPGLTFSEKAPDNE
jgi:hypothetical protein